MTKIPRLTGEDVVRRLRREGFEIARRRGSHVFLRHPDGRKTVVPVHRGETIHVGLMSKIQKDVKMSREEFVRILTES